ncbi:MAG: SRPBCC family protein [Alphaproteobacteria bacterium]|nr:SRPBCC family protein [Alphaproteobacteria bacterium]
MTTLTVQRRIAAPADLVFTAITDIARLPDTNKDVLSVEFLTEQRAGVGTRFRETRRMGKGELVTELEVAEYDPVRRRYRAVTDTDGTTWDTAFRVEQGEGEATLTIEMDARGHTWLKRTRNTLMKGLFRRGMESHLNELQAWCEKEAQGASAMEQSRSN